MQLYYSQTSPFARKVTLLLHYTRLIDQCELITTSFDNDALREKNPLGKIPALVDGQLSLFESDLICEYLDDKFALEGNLSLINRGSRDYYPEQKAAAQANGVMEAAVSSVFEKRRDTAHSEYWLSRWQGAISTGLNTLELEHCGTDEKPNMATFCLAAALGYLDFRHATFDWRAQREDMLEWFNDVKTHDWFQKTEPKP